MLLVYILFLSVLRESWGSDNSTLWGGLMRDCKTPSYSCVEGNLRGYLERALELDDIRLTDSVVFTKNANKYRAPTARSSPSVAEDRSFGEVVSSVEEQEGRTLREAPKSLIGVSDILYDKAVTYLMNHDLSLKLPETFFNGATLKIAPKSIEADGGALVKFDIVEKSDGSMGEGRLFKKLRQLLKKRLLTSFLAALLIIALIKVKLLFLAPLLLGVGTAKKLLLKVLLFLFPALTHLFKLCAYYHHHHTKYHLHHHHQIAHHHHHGHPPIIHSSHHGHSLHGPPVVVSAPSGPGSSPSYSHVQEDYAPYPDYPPHPPGGGYSRSDPLSTAPDNELTSWGIDPPSDSTGPGGISRVYSTAAIQKTAPIQNSVKNLKEKKRKTEDYDQFYSPILERLDEIMGQLGIYVEACKERLICSMYKAPERFSPHSNLVSNQLSRDSSELQRPGYSNAAVIRFYRYVQAARDGQDHKDCLILYPACSVVTE